MDTTFSDYSASLFTKEDASCFPETVILTNIKCCDIKFTKKDVNSGISRLTPDRAASPDGFLPRFLGLLHGSAETTVAEGGQNPVAGLWGRTLGES